MHALHGIGRATPRAFPAQRRGRSPRNAQSQQNPLFCGYDGNLCSAEPSDCAAPRPVPVQCRPLRFPSCPGNSDPFAMVSRTGPTPPVFCYLRYQHNRVQSDARYGFGNLPVLNVVIWRIAIIMQTFTELVAIRFSKTAQQNTAYPVHKI